MGYDGYSMLFWLEVNTGLPVTPAYYITYIIAWITYRIKWKMKYAI